MNERIRELAECARCWAKVKLQDSNYGYNSRLYENLYNEKLAELIVKECAKWIKNTDSDPDIGDEDAKALLKHFGVE